MAQPSSLEQELGLEEEEGITRAQRGLLNFTLHTFPAYEVNWHHRVLCKVLNDFAAGHIKRVIVCQPPRTGKSELVSRRLPAFMMGQNPRIQIIGASYSAGLANLMNRDVQRIIESPAYKQIFPETRLGSDRSLPGTTSWLKNSGIFEVVGYGGSYRSVGVGGGVTGMGADRALIDDPIKNQEEADSFVYRQKLWEWYGSTFYTRLEKDAGILVTATRWHEDDIIGRLLTLAKQDPLADQWLVVNLPAVAEGDLWGFDPRQPGEALWPAKYDLARLAAVKASVGSKIWSSLYQQRPTPDGGAIVKRHWWQFYKELPERMDVTIQAWDLTFKKSASSDYVVGAVLGRKDADIFLLDLVRDRMSFSDTLAALRRLTAKWPHATAKYVEQAANGEALMDTLKHEIPGIIGIPATGSKIARANAVSPLIESGNVYLPHPSIAPWIGDVVEEWTAFPAGAHDDIVDAMSHGIAKLAKKRVTDFLPVSISGVNTFRY